MTAKTTKISLEDWAGLVGRTNAFLLGLGEPVERDDRGYNKADFHTCLNAGIEPEGDLLADVAERLIKYHRQIGKDTVDTVKAGLGLYGDSLDRGRAGVSAIASDGQALIFFKYHAEFVAAIKRLPKKDRRYDYTRTAWVVSPASLVAAADLLEGAGANVASVRRLAEQFGPQRDGGADEPVAPSELLVEIWEDGQELVIKHEYDEPLNDVYRAAKVYFDRDTRTRRISREFRGRPVKFAPKAKAVLKALLARKEAKISGLGLLKAWASQGKVEQPIVLRPIDDVLLSGMSLLPYQADGVGFVERAGYNCIIGDEMGLGKTVQFVVSAMRAGLRTLVVCPASLKYNWAREIAKFTRGTSYVATTNGDARPICGIPNAVSGGPSGDWRTRDFVVINGDILIDRSQAEKVDGKKTGKKVLVKSVWADALKTAGFGLLGVDESHYYKNWKAKRTQRLAEIAAYIPRRVELSGTVIKSRPVELYSQLRLVSPEIAGRFIDFAKTYCGGYRDRYGFHADGATNLDDLHRRIQPVYLRRLKKDVLPDLPPKLHSEIPVELDTATRKRYSRAASDFVAFLRSEGDSKAAARAKRAEHLTSVTALKQMTLKAKIAAAIEFITNANEQGEKVVLFSGYTEVIGAITAQFGETCVRVTGDDAPVARDAAVQAFQNDPKIMVFAGNITAAGVGLTLTASNKVLFTDEPWTPGDVQQAEDRCHRIGQNDCVNVYTLLAIDTIDNMIHSLLRAKADVVAEVQDGKAALRAAVTHAIEAGGDIFDELIECIKQSPPAQDLGTVSR